MNSSLQIFSLLILGGVCVLASDFSTPTPEGVTNTTILVETAASRFAEAVGFEAEDVATDTAEYCQKIKDLAYQVYIEADDAREEVGLTDTVSEEEAQDYYYYTAKEAAKIMNLADECMDVMMDSLSMEPNLVSLSSDLALSLEVQSINMTDVEAMIDEISDMIADYQGNVTLWVYKFTEISENIIAAVRDAQEELEEEEGASDEAIDDAKDSKNKIKEFVNDIIDIAADMLDDAEESYEDMMEDLDSVGEELDM